MKTSVYLAGAINGLTYKQATEWRNVASKRLKKSGYEILDPMRGKEFLNVGKEPINDSLLEISPEEIVNRDLSDINKASIILCNLSHLGERTMIGTLFELGYAHKLRDRKLIIGFGIPEKYENHPFLTCAVLPYKNLQSALSRICRK